MNTLEHTEEKELDVIQLLEGLVAIYEKNGISKFGAHRGGYR